MPERKALKQRCVSLLVYRKNYTLLLSALECGGDDGTRTRGLCRDRVTGQCNLLEINGTDSPFLIL